MVFTFPAVRVFGLALALATLAAPVQAESLHAEYDIRLRGIPVGTSQLSVTAQDGKYSVSTSGRIKGLLRIFSDWEASGEASGALKGGAIAPARYSLEWTEDDDTEAVRLAFADARVTEVSVVPPPRRRKNLVPIERKHKAGVLDPLSAMIFPAAAEDGPAVCNRTLPLFDGTQRFDLALTFDRVETVEGRGDSYSGPAYVCAVRYRPVAGHRPNRSSVRFMADNEDMEVWMARIGGTGLFAPVMTRLRVKAGMLVIEARRFEVS